MSNLSTKSLILADLAAALARPTGGGSCARVGPIRGWYTSLLDAYVIDL